MSWHMFPSKRRPESPRPGFFERSRKRKPFSAGEPHGAFPSGMAALWVTAGAVAVYTLLFSSLHQIDEVRVTGARDIGEDRVETAVREFLSRKIFRLFPGDNYFLFSGSRLEDDLADRFPKSDSVRVEKSFPHSIGVFITERDRIFLWCSGGPCFLVDGNGCTADARFAEQEMNEPFLVRFVDESAVPVAPGECSIPSGLPETVLLLERGLREKFGFTVHLPASTPSRVAGEIRFRVEEGWEVRANAAVPPEKTFSALRAVLETEIPEERREKLRYIDLRTENKAFYSFIPEEPVPENDKKDDEDKEEKKED